MPRMVTIGTLREVPKLDANGEPGAEMRGVGQRIAHPAMMERVALFMRSLDEQEAEVAVRRWLENEPDRVPGPTAVAAALAKVNEHREAFLEKDMVREAAYCELAGFCIQCCIDEAPA